MDYGQFLATVFSDEQPPEPTQSKKRTAEDIMAELMPFVEADKKRGG